MFADYFDALETYTPAKDKRFSDTKKINSKVGLVPAWAQENLAQSQFTGVLVRNTIEAYTNLFTNLKLDQMLQARTTTSYLC